MLLSQFLIAVLAAPPPVSAPSDPLRIGDRAQSSVDTAVISRIEQDIVGDLAGALKADDEARDAFVILRALRDPSDPAMSAPKGKGKEDVAPSPSDLQTAASAALATSPQLKGKSEKELQHIVDRAKRRHQVKARFSVKANSGAVEGALQVLGQVVVDKAVESGWEMLASQLKRLADPTHFPNVHKALELDIHDLIAQPDTLVYAALLDVFDITDAGSLKPGAFGGDFMIDWKGLRAAWKSDRAQGVEKFLTTALRSRVIAVYGENAECSALASVPLKAAWTIGKCSGESFAECDVDTIARDSCKIDDATRPRFVAAVTASGGAVTPRDAVNTLFELERLRFPDEATGKVDEVLRLLQDLVVGLLDRDTNRAMAAAAQLAVRLLGVADVKVDETDDAKTAATTKQVKLREDTRAFFLILAGAARYASAQGTDEEKLEARKDIIKELITRTTRRNNRKSGVVVSLGGSFGLVGGARFAAGGSKPGLASPLHLGLGVGLQSYHPKQRAGVHLELSPVDLGQYVVFSNKNLTVEKPDLKAAIAPSFKLGVHLGGRYLPKATPLYLAGFFGLSPFVREGGTGERMTFTAGVMLGIYVPFVSFN